MQLRTLTDDELLRLAAMDDAAKLEIGRRVLADEWESGLRYRIEELESEIEELEADLDSANREVMMLMKDE